MTWNDLRKGRISEQNREYLVTFVCHGRESIFLDHRSAHLFCQQLIANEARHQCKWLTWVLMPDHFHGLVQLGTSSLSHSVGHLKGLTSKRINERRHSSRAIWQPAFHDHALRQEEDRLHIARYIVANPLRAGLVQTLGHYPYWNSVYF